MELKLFTKDAELTADQTHEVVTFLYQSLEQYGDPMADIAKAVAYATSSAAGQGGFVWIAYQEAQVVGAVVVLNTGMSDYIPENILVYIAISKALRGKGLGGQLMRQAIDTAQGNIALHVEATNPARHLYERLGFENKYVEMRLIKK